MAASDRHAHDRLSPDHLAWLASLPATLRWRDDVLLIHGTPTSDLQYLMETVTGDYAPGVSPGVRPASTEELRARLADAMRGVPQALVLCGHTHVPRCERLDGLKVVNLGSVGLPAYDDDHPHPHVIENGSPKARYALFSRRPDGWIVKLRRVDYDAESAAAQADRHGRPDWAHALRTGRMGPHAPQRTGRR